MLRALAWALRFVHNCRHRVNRRYGPVSCSELRIAEMGILRAIQAQSFQMDILALKNGASCSTGLRRLSPFLDPAGLLRVGGRLEESALEYAAKHPVLLPKNNFITDMLVDHYHRLHFHAGPRLLQSLLARRYWIISFRATVRKRIYKCVACFRHKPRNTPPRMADLPRARVRPSRPFSSTSVDYAGPFIGKIHSRSRARAKMYLCLFVCTATKAVHLEAVSSMTTEAFLASLRRFMARRGLCHDIYCDRGTNFVGASTELRKMFKNLDSVANSENLAREMVDRGVVWHFQPPAAPHFGGLHEAAIRLAKYHVSRVMGKQVLTFEEMQTLFTQVEAVLNSRPLCSLSSDPSESEVLTPAHFLIGEPLVTLPEAKLNPTSSNTRWRLVQAMHRHFWNRWHHEYLHTIIERTKWYRDEESLQVGTLVLIQEDKVPPLHWKMGRVMEILPGSDGIVRVVKVKTETGTLTRPAVKIFPLPLE